MNVSAAVPHDELLLAQLVSAKLARVINGMLSVGLATLELDSPTAFLSGKDKVLLGFIEVLRCVAVKPGNAEAIEVLRRQTHQLSDLAIRFCNLFTELARWRD